MIVLYPSRRKTNATIGKEYLALPHRLCRPSDPMAVVALRQSIYSKVALMALVVLIRAEKRSNKGNDILVQVSRTFRHKPRACTIVQGRLNSSLKYWLPSIERIALDVECINVVVEKRLTRVVRESRKSHTWAESGRSRRQGTRSYLYRRLFPGSHLNGWHVFCRWLINHKSSHSVPLYARTQTAHESSTPKKGGRGKRITHPCPLYLNGNESDSSCIKG